MSRLRAAWRQYRAHRAHVRALNAQRLCCRGNCTTADSVLRAQLGTIPFPRQIRREF